MNSTRKLVDSLEEQERLESLIDSAKSPTPVGPSFVGLHYLLMTPFRHPPLRYGSRFGTRGERGIWYGSDELSVAFAEVGYYRLLFLSASDAVLEPGSIPLSAFQVSVATPRGIDLSQPPFAARRDEIAAPDSYAASHALGTAMREAGVEAFRFPSARASWGTNVGLFEPVFAAKAPKSVESWTCFVDRTAIELRPQHVPGRQPFRFRREDFEIGGRLPAPGVEPSG